MAEDFLQKTVPDALDEIAKLTAAEDPEEEPFRSKYKACELIEGLLRQLEPLSESADEGPATRGRLLDIGAHLTFKLGSLNVDTEDWARGDEMLTRAKQQLSRDDAGPACLYDLLDVNNTLGILWVNRGEPERAVGFLDAAKEVYERMKERPNVDGEELSLRREASHSQTLFYLAQVMGVMGREDEAAALCGQCLTRQVASPGAGSCFSVDDWCQNAAQLGGYYITKGMWATGRALIAGAEHVFASEFPAWEDAIQHNTPELDKKVNETMRESIREVGANIQLAWGKLHLHRLQKGRDRLEGHYPLDSTAQAEESAGARLAVSFPTLELDAAKPGGQPPPENGWVPVDTEAARSVFNSAVPRYRAALRHYILNGFVTEHCTALMDLSELHKALAAFEEGDIARHCALHKRRAAPLEPIVAKLNHNKYQGLSKTMMYEIGEAHRACFEAKLSAGRPRARVVASGRRTIKGYTDFVVAYHEGGQPPQRVEEDEEHGYLTARFHLSRLHSKCFPSEAADGPGEAEALARALREYEFLVDYCKHNEPKGFEQELDICSEMVQLLPAKIDAIKATF